MLYYFLKKYFLKKRFDEVLQWIDNNLDDFFTICATENEKIDEAEFKRIFELLGKYHLYEFMWVLTQNHLYAIAHHLPPNDLS